MLQSLINHWDHDACRLPHIQQSGSKVENTHMHQKWGAQTSGMRAISYLVGLGACFSRKGWNFWGLNFESSFESSFIVHARHHKKWNMEKGGGAWAPLYLLYLFLHLCMRYWWSICTRRPEDVHIQGVHLLTLTKIINASKLASVMAMEMQLIKEFKDQMPDSMSLQVEYLKAASRQRCS